MKDTANQSLDANREKMVWNENNIEKAMKELQSLSRSNSRDNKPDEFAFFECFD